MNKKFLPYDQCLKMTKDGFIPKGNGLHYVIDSKNAIPYLAEYLLYDEECWCVTTDDWSGFYTQDKVDKHKELKATADQEYSNLYNIARNHVSSGFGSQHDANLTDYAFTIAVDWTDKHPSKEAIAIVLKNIESLRNIQSEELFNYWVDKIYSEIYSNK